MLAQPTDAELLASVPDFLTVGALLKATPVEEGGRRLLYMEASKETSDQVGETVLAKALADQRDFYLKYGNIDIDHYTVIGAKHGIPDYLTYEIGKPLDVAQRDGRTFVKAELYQSAGRLGGSGPMVEKANMVWDSMTKLQPPQRWYPSVGGGVLNKSIRLDGNGNRRVVIDKVRWTNTCVSKTPAHGEVSGVSTVPMEVFAKCLGAAGTVDWTMAKSLTAGYGTDSATFEGGAALRKESFDGSQRARRDGINYWQFREWIAGQLRGGKVASSTGKGPDAVSLVAHTMRHFGDALDQDQAAEFVERFVRDLGTGLGRRRMQ